MKYRIHGANPFKVYSNFGIEVPSQVVDFSTNTNVLESNISFDLNLKEVAETYPCDDSVDLVAAIAKNENVLEENVLVTNGINEVIYLLLSKEKGLKVGILGPSYPEYEKAAKAYNHEVLTFKDLSEVKAVDIIFICNPNNPTGSYISNQTLERFAKANEDTLVIIDESYRDFVEDVEIAIDVKSNKNVVLLRSLTKIYHLSGLRVGFILSHEKNIQAVKSIQPTWSVNGVAQLVALRFISDKTFVKKTKMYYAKETKKLVQAIEDLGFETRPTKVNFFLVKVEDDERIIRYLLKQGIVVRHTRNYPFLSGDYIRVACKKEEENQLLINALRGFINEVNSN